MTDDNTLHEVTAKETAEIVDGGNDGLSDSSQAVQADDVKGAEKVSQWKGLPLSSDWIDVYVTDVKDPDRFTVCCFVSLMIAVSVLNCSP